MSNNIYDILAKFNAVDQAQQSQVQTQPKAKTQLAENIANIESQLNEKYMGFKKTVAAIKKGGSAEDPEAVAAAIGREKYGTEKFQQAAARGKKLGEDEHDVRKDLKEMDKSQPSSDRGGESSGDPYAKGGKATPVKSKAAAKDAEKILNKSMKKAHKKGVAEDTLNEVTQGVEHSEWVDNVKDHYHPTPVKIVKQRTEDGRHIGSHAMIGDKKVGQYNMNTGVGTFTARKKQDVAEGEGVYRHKGTYGTSYDPNAPEKSTSAVKRGRGRPKKDTTPDGAGGPKFSDAAKQFFGVPKKDFDPRKLPGQASVKHKIKDESVEGVAEVAPPGAKAERMVKHIKKGYANDGKLTAREKGIAYATAWKAHKAGRVEEAVNALRVLADSGMTAEQITEGWQDMMKAVKATHDSEKTTGKFNKEKDTVTGGTRYTRKYNPKTGETDDTENVTAVKRGRGRPKKHAFEHFAEVYESILEQSQSVSGRVTPLPTTVQKPTSGATKTAPAMGTIDKYGMWSSKPPRPGEKGVALPSPQEQPQEESVGDTDMQEMMRLAGMEEALRGGQKKLDKNKNGRLDAADFAMLRGEMEEGNEFTGALDAARDAGKKEFEVDGRTYPVKEEMDEGSEMCEGCGYTMTECGCDSAMPNHEQEGHMSISMNVSSDGKQSLNVNAEGEDAAKLAQLLKLAGLGSSHEQPVYHPVQVSLGDEQPEEFEEAKDERYHASTTPDEEVYGVDRLIKGGNGDVAGQEKTMRKHGYQFGDNPIAMKETVARDYESIKVKK